MIGLSNAIPEWLYKSLEGIGGLMAAIVMLCIVVTHYRSKNKEENSVPQPSRMAESTGEHEGIEALDAQFATTGNTGSRR
jgi:hypothetical protein